MKPAPLPPTKRKLDDDQVLYVLRSEKSSRRLADELDVSLSTIQNLRHGLSYKAVHPDEPRLAPGASKNSPNCRDCVHHLRERCTMGFPEYDGIGGRAACTCAAYRSALS